MQEIPNQSNVTKDSVEKLENIGGAKEQLLSLLDSESYADRYAHVETFKEREEIDSIEVEAAKEARKEMKMLISESAANLLGVSLEEGQRMGKDWGQAMNSVSSLEYEGETFEITKASSEELLERIGNNIRGQSHFRTKLKLAEEGLTIRHSEATDRISNMKDSLFNLDDEQDLQTVFDSWGQAPDENGERGEDDKGYNSGVVHYFQYRASEEKASRFKREKVEFSIDGFKQKTLDYIDAITDPSQESVVSSYLFSDEGGSRRMVTLTEENEIIVAFANPEEDLKVVTVFSQKNEKLALKQFKSIVDKEVSMETGSDQRLNKLGDGRKLDWSKEIEETA